MHPDLRLAGALPPLDAPHHARADEWTRWREGVVIASDVGQGGGSVVDVGLDLPAIVDLPLRAGARVTLAMGASRPDKLAPPPADGPGLCCAQRGAPGHARAARGSSGRGRALLGVQCSAGAFPRRGRDREPARSRCRRSGVRPDDRDVRARCRRSRSGSARASRSSRRNGSLPAAAKPDKAPTPRPAALPARARRLWRARGARGGRRRGAVDV